MIQRIQSIFLLLASGSCFGLFGLPFAQTATPQADSRLFADTAYNLWDNPALLSIFIGAGAVLLLAIFLFRNRKLQIRLSQAGFLMLLAGIGLGLFFFFRDAGHDDASFAFGTVLPVLAVVFSYFGFHYIRKDDKLVKSMDRLR